MYNLKKNDRVRLVSCNDPYTRLVPGDLGTVRMVTTNLGDLDIIVKWDSGSTLSMIPAAGDRVERVAKPTQS